MKRNKVLLSIIILLIVIFSVGNRTVVTNSCNPNPITAHSNPIIGNGAFITRTCNITYATKVFRALYRDFFYYYIASIVTKDKKNRINKQEAVVEYISHNVFARMDQKAYPPIDHPGLDVLVRGVGWCDQVADLFIRLLEWSGIQAFDVFLYDFKDGRWTSPHTVALAVPSGIGNGEYRAMMGAGGSPHEADNNQNWEGRKIGGVVDVLAGNLQSPKCFCSILKESGEHKDDECERGANTQRESNIIVVCGPKKRHLKTNNGSLS